MDKSERYVEKCREAVKIQGSRPSPKRGDVWWSVAWNQAALFTEKEWQFIDDPFNGLRIEERRFQRGFYDRFTWLPRQDQLQNMVREEYVSARKMMVHFGQWCLEYGDVHASGEELWFDFVMKTKYGEVWNGEEWIKDPE